jgi:hypothetical protein
MPAPAQAQMCEPYLVWCNYGKYYSGTVTSSSVLEVNTPKLKDSSRWQVTATITLGKVSCSGQEGAIRESPEGRYQAEGRISGSGLLIVEKPHSDPTDKSGQYQISVACPSAELRWSSVPKGGGYGPPTSGVTPARPATENRGADAIIYEHEATDLSRLAGTETYEHPDADAVNHVTGTVTITWSLSSGPQVVKAEPGGPYTSVRGEPLTLDGSASEGENLTYGWTFAPKGCPAGAAGRTGAKLDGPTPKVTLLCSMDVTLTVSNGAASDKKTVSITVSPRDWKTPFNHVETEGVVPAGGGRPVIEGASSTNPGATQTVRMVGGQNVCALDPDAADHSLHPLPTAGSWEKTGYELRRIAEPGGPFDGYWFVATYLMRIERQTRVNPYLLPGAAGFRGPKSFYVVNKEWNTDVDGYLAAIRAHEGAGQGRALGHSALLKQELTRADPTLKIEPLFEASARDALTRRVDGEIHQAELSLCNAAKDPLPEIWRGSLVFLRIDTDQWIKMDAPAIVGGASYGTPVRCQ